MRGIYKSLILIAACMGALAACGGSDSSSSSQSLSTSAQSKQLQRSDKAVASDYQTVVEELYVSYFGRPADPTGLTNFENALLAANAPTDIQSLNTAYSTSPAIQALINNFGNSPESIALYGTGNPTAFVTAVYQNVLNRAPQQSGLTFWVNAISSDQLSQGNAALAIMAGALANTTAQGILDATLIENRLTVASYFTAQVVSQDAVSGYAGSAAAASARATLSAVTATTNTTAYETTVNAAVAALVPTNNVQPIIVDTGPDPVNSPTLNEAFTSVTICAPANPTLCQTIDHVLIDTGSSGLRLISSVLSPAMTSALSAQTTGGTTSVECTMFVDGYTWGPVRSVNFQIAGESAQSMLMQVIGDPNFSAEVPDTCSSSGPAENTVDAFGANGVIGVGLFQQDCGPYCVTLADNYNYYICSSLACTPTTVSLTQQVPNPVSLFAKDNNGVIINLPAVAAGEAVSISGTMTFGIGTQSNNALGSAAIYQMDPTYGEFTTIFDGRTLSGSFIDSGSNGLFFPNLTRIGTCNDDGFYCPPSQLNLSATMQGTNNVSGVINFSIADVDTALNINPNDAVYIPLGAPNSDSTSFDWGLPFFFGRNVFVVTENQTVSETTGPFIAF